MVQPRFRARGAIHVSRHDAPAQDKTGAYDRRPPVARFTLPHMNDCEDRARRAGCGDHYRNVVSEPDIAMRTPAIAALAVVLLLAPTTQSDAQRASGGRAPISGELKLAGACMTREAAHDRARVAADAKAVRTCRFLTSGTGRRFVGGRAATVSVRSMATRVNGRKVECRVRWTARRYCRRR